MDTRTFDHVPSPEALRYGLKTSTQVTLLASCADGIAVASEGRPPSESCREAGEFIEYAEPDWPSRNASTALAVLEVAAVDELPDLAACFYRVGYDVTVREVGSIPGFGL